MEEENIKSPWIVRHIMEWLIVEWQKEEYKEKKVKNKRN